MKKNWKNPPATHRLTTGPTLFKAFLAAALLAFTAAALADNYADRTPGDRHLAEGMRAYHKGRYHRAMASFVSAARWADKVAQYNLGVMHLYGQGVEQDPGRAWAWFQLSAERSYPKMMETAEHIWQRLEEDERKRGRRILEEELLQRFGDRTAVPRTARHLRRQMRNAAGTRTGSRASAGVNWVWDVDHVQFDNVNPNQARGLYITGTRYRGDEYYDPAKFNFYEVLAAESVLFDAESRGQVSLGELKILEDPDDSED